MLKAMLQCLAIGIVLFAGERAWTAYTSDPLAPRGRVIIDAAVLAQLEREAVAQTGRSASSSELSRRLDLWIDDELLYREARRFGLDRGDPVIYARLVRNMRFLGAEPGLEPDPERSDQLYREALALGMDESDLVVRRRLIQQMRFVIEAPARSQAPDDAALRAELDGNRERYVVPPRVRLTQVYLSRDRRGAALRGDAERLLDGITREGLTPEQAAQRADPFLHPSRQPLQSARQLAKQFGPAFAKAVLDASLPLETWLGPFESAYGDHLVWLSERTPETLPPLDPVRRAVAGAVLSQRSRRAVADALAGLRARYEILRPPEVAE